MAFLDNSGDIILDAVLTDTGRFRMARGDFKITKFALGDDEIDYSLFNRNHPSGSYLFLSSPMVDIRANLRAREIQSLETLARTSLQLTQTQKTRPILCLQLTRLERASFSAPLKMVV